MLLEWEHRKILLTGDAFAPDLVEALALVDHGNPVELEVVKLPHHGSKNNVSRAFVEAVDCPYWVFSTDGTRFRHPDAVAIARVLLAGSRANPRLGFNVPSKYNQWWNNDAWMGLFGCTVEFGNVDDGLVLTFEPGIE